MWRGKDGFTTLHHCRTVKAAVGGPIFPGRAACIELTAPGKDKVSIGTFGILHPNVLAEFDIQYPASCMELDLEALM